MTSRWYSVAVVGLWLASMTWLVTQKVLPPLMTGEPPSYRSMADSTQPPVGWRALLGGRQLGWAVTMIHRLPNGTAEIRSRVHFDFDRDSVGELIPDWIRNLLAIDFRWLGTLQLDTENTLTLDPLDRLVEIETAVRTNAGQETIRISAAVEGNRLKVTVRPGDFTQEVYLPSNALVGDALSPQARLTDLHQGQTWRAPSYSFLQPPSSPMETLEATVKEQTTIIWNGRAEDVWLVEYRSDSGLGSTHGVRSRLWVRLDGTVLRQHVMVFDTVLAFDRLPDDAVAAILEADREQQSRRFPSLRRLTMPDRID